MKMIGLKFALLRTSFSLFCTSFPEGLGPMSAMISTGLRSSWKKLASPHKIFF
jgi:hypothetical protein